SAVQPETTTEAGESTPEAGSFVAENIYPELFVAPVSDLNAAQQITTLRSPNTGHPSWAPDSIQIAFSSDFDGDEEIYVITEDGQNLRQLTFNETVDRQP